MQTKIKVLVRQGTGEFMTISGSTLVATDTPAVHHSSTEIENLHRRVSGEWPHDVILVGAAIHTDNVNY